MEERLQKILAGAGVASRRAAERLILEGRVRVNGRIVDVLGSKADPERDDILVDGRPVGNREGKKYFLFYKPLGYLTTLNDPQNRPTIRDFLNKINVRVYPVGRLDMDTEGLLVLTNDGDLARRLMHPRFHVPKVYRVKVQGIPDQSTLVRLAEGVLMIGDRPAAPAEVEIIKTGRDRSWLKMTLFEGRRRQVRRMCSQVGHPVLKLKRIAYGPLTLGAIKPGDIRPLTTEEIKALKKAADQ